MPGDCHRSSGPPKRVRYSGGVFTLLQALLHIRRCDPAVPPMARPTGIEPVTAGLEGRCSIQLSYGRSDRIVAFQRMPGHVMVGVEGFEPPTSCSQSRRATRLRYTPVLQSPRVRPGELVIVAKRVGNCRRRMRSSAACHNAESSHRLCSRPSAGWPS